MILEISITTKKILVLSVKIYFVQGNYAYMLVCIWYLSFYLLLACSGFFKWISHARDKQRSTKHTHTTKDRVTRTPLNIGDELICSGRVGSSCSTSGTRHVNLVWVWIGMIKFATDVINILAWLSPNKLPTMIHGQVFCIIRIVTWQPLIEGTPLSATWREFWTGLWAWTLGTITSTQCFQFKMTTDGMDVWAMKKGILNT
jgi:hypothetical protein